jgi:hypothetical protein
MRACSVSEQGSHIPLDPRTFLRWLSRWGRGQHESGSPSFSITPRAFTAAATGEIIAYFAGAGATFDLQLGLLVNGVDTGVVGLDNKTSMIGQSLDLGHANAGDALTFVLHNLSLPTLNVSYDIDGSVGHQHVYSTPYTATSPILDSIPVGK